MRQRPDDQPYFHISVVAEMLGLHPQTIRNYERMGLISPSRTDGNMRLFSVADLERVKRIQSYTSAGVNLAGVEIIVKLLDQMQEMQMSMETEMERKQTEMEREVVRLRKLLRRVRGETSGDNEENNR